MTTQGITVNYTNDIVTCQICHCCDNSDGKTLQMDTCKHTYHVCCLIDYIGNNSMCCPECNERFYDVRLSLAVAYKFQNTGRFIDILGGYAM